MNQKIKTILYLFFSYSLSFICFSWDLNIFMSSTEYWYWHENDGLVGIALFYSIPFLITSLFIRYYSLKYNHFYEYIDGILSLMIVSIFFLPRYILDLFDFSWVAAFLCLISVLWSLCKIFKLFKGLKSNK